MIVKDKFTVLINTFKRPDMMKAAVAHYAACPYVGEVYVTWSEEGPPPAALVENYNKHKNPKVRAELTCPCAVSWCVDR